VGRVRRVLRRARLPLGEPALLSALQAYLRAVAAQGRERRDAGGFEVFVNPQRDAPMSNYAIPRDGLEPTPGDVAELVAAFEAAHRLPRLEYVPATAPAAEPALLAAGFEVELRTSVLTCTPDTLVRGPLPAGAELEALEGGTPLRDVDAMTRVQAEAFGDEHVPLDRPPAWLGHHLATLARVEGEPAGGGMTLAVAWGTTELVGIAVAEPFRRRGLARAITADLAARAFEAGAGSAFLTPGDEAAERVYAGAGFRPTDEMLHLRRPTPPAASR
jgi:GNAT superfamily N-acetyltransferase